MIKVNAMNLYIRRYLQLQAQSNLRQKSANLVYLRSFQSGLSIDGLAYAERWFYLSLTFPELPSSLATMKLHATIRASSE